jgi:hypothetical protein
LKNIRNILIIHKKDNKPKENILFRKKEIKLLLLQKETIFWDRDIFNIEDRMIHLKAKFEVLVNHWEKLNEFIKMFIKIQSQKLIEKKLKM